MKWRPVTIKGCKLSVCEDGQVRRADRDLKRCPDRYGYQRIRIRIGGKQISLSIHGLVAAAFMGPMPKGHEVDHLDGDRANNNWRNLEYVTREENVRRSIVRGRAPQGPYKRISQETARDMARLHRPGSRTVGIRGLAKTFGVDPASVRRAIKRATESVSP